MSDGTAVPAKRRRSDEDPTIDNRDALVSLKREVGTHTHTQVDAPAEKERNEENLYVSSFVPPGEISCALQKLTTASSRKAMQAKRLVCVTLQRH